MLNVNQQTRKRLHKEIVNTSLLTISSVCIPTFFNLLIYWAMFGVFGEAYAYSETLFFFYVFMSMSYVVAMAFAWAGGVTLVTKIICAIMLAMVVDNLVMALDAMNLSTWSALESLDDFLQLACGSAFIGIGVLCLITRLWVYARQSWDLPSGL